jgi:hypothetical protein
LGTRFNCPQLLFHPQCRTIVFEQTSRLAEKVAASVSRRGFLGSLGGWAAAAAMGVAGLLIGAGTARADNVTGACCFYAPQASGVPGLRVFYPGATSCPCQSSCDNTSFQELVSVGKNCGNCHAISCNRCPGRCA